MKKIAAILLAILLLCSAALADPVTFGSVSAESNAEYIDMGDQVVKDFSSFIAFLQEFPNLKKVDMFATQVTSAQVSMLEEVLPNVEFGWKLQLMKYKNKHIVRTDATAFSTLHGICPNHRSEEFALLNYCTNLLALDLGHNNLTDIAFLRSMPHLRVLILGENQKLKNIEEIARLQELEYLELFTCGITDISPLMKLPNLMDLNLANNKVEDWRPLKEMKQLKRLWISGMCAKAMTETEKKELQEALPDTEIMFKGEPTDYGWRELSDGSLDPHYEIVYEIFHTEMYIPFADSAPLNGDDTPSAGPFLVTEDIDEEELNSP